MAIEICIYPTMPTRPCSYCLALQEGAVFADFNVDDDTAYIARISFDGYGCCTVDDPTRKMKLEDSRRFIEMIESKNIIRDEMSEILSNYFQENMDLIWKDALVEHDLL